MTLEGFPGTGATMASPDCRSIVISLLFAGPYGANPAQNGPPRANPIVFLLLLTMAGRWNAPIP
jgi:hypothetical protein